MLYARMKRFVKKAHGKILKFSVKNVTLCTSPPLWYNLPDDSTCLRVSADTATCKNFKEQLSWD
jgi:hypothetical protein